MSRNVDTISTPANSCGLCGVKIYEQSRRRVLPLPDEPNACVCASCLNRKGEQPLDLYLSRRVVALEAEIALARIVMSRMEPVLEPSPKPAVRVPMRAAAPQTGIVEPAPVKAAMLDEWDAMGDE